MLVDVSIIDGKMSGQELRGGTKKKGRCHLNCLFC